MARVHRASAARALDRDQLLFGSPLELLLTSERRDLTGRPLELDTQEPDPDPNAVWAAAMDGIEDPQTFVYSEDEFVEEGSGDDAELGNTERQEIPSGDSAGPLAEVEEEQDTGLKALDLEHLELGASKYRALPLQSIESAQSPLTHAEFINELVLLLLNLSSAEGLSLRGVSAAVSSSVIRRFMEFRTDLWQLRESDRVSALDELRSQHCSTIPQLVLLVEQLIFRHSMWRTRTIDISVLHMWLTGDPSLVRTREGRFDLCEVNVRSQALPTWLQHEKLLPTTIFACLLRVAFSYCPTAAVGVLTPTQYDRSINRTYLFHASTLLKMGLRNTLLDTWRRLSSVYLAQDARTLIFLDRFLEEEVSTGLDAGLVFDSVWGPNDVKFDENLMPHMEIAMHPLVSQLYGPNMNRVFHESRLESTWSSILRAMRDREPEVELEMASLASEIVEKIQRLEVLSPEDALFA